MSKLHPVLSLKVQFYSYPVEISQKTTLRFPFQHETFPSNQDFQRNLDNSQYILHGIAIMIVFPKYLLDARR